MQDNHITALLDLEGVSVVHFENLEDSIHFTIELKERPCSCPACGSSKIEAHDTREQRIKDLPIYNKPTFLRFLKRKYRCRHCSKRFSHPAPFIQKKNQMTNRLKIFFINSLKDTVTFKQVAKSNFVFPSSVFRFFRFFSMERKETPKVLCIDEFKGDAGGNPYQAALADGEHHTLIDILPSTPLKRLCDPV